MQFIKNAFNKYNQHLIQQECERYKSKYPVASKSFLYAMDDELLNNENMDTQIRILMVVKLHVQCSYNDSRQNPSFKLNDF